ncbi:hypothetical protein GCM10029978_008730 [Actinoallomurus acanthiterrae]
MLLERDRELAVLHALLRRAASGSGGTAVVTGPPGAGKTTLLAAIRDAGPTYGLTGPHARGHEFERDIGFGVASALLGPVEAGPADVLARRLYWQVEAVGPLLLTVDDIHWSDAGSLQFLCHLAEHVDELPVALVLACRAGGEHDPWLDRLLTLPGVERIPARPLSAAAVERLVTDAVPGAAPDFVAACTRMSGGNAFLLIELLRSLDDGTPADITGVVPDAVLRSVLARLTRLPAETRRLAEAVAVLGDDVPFPRAATLARLDLAAAERAADLLAAAHLLRPGAPLAFVHPLIGSAIHSGLPRFARARAHRAAADLLVGDGESPDAVAAHLLLTEPLGEARTVPPLVTAATRAARRGDTRSAVRLLRRALDEPPPQPDRAALLTDLAAVLFRVGDRSAERAAADALELAAGPVEQARAHEVLAQIHLARGDHTGAAAHSGTALRLLESGSVEWQDLLVRHLDSVVFRPGRTAEVGKWIAAIASPEHPGLRTHVALHHALRGESGDAARHARVLVADPRPLADEHGALAGLLVHALALTDDLAAAEEVADRALTAARERGAVIAYANASFHRALCRHLRGSLSDAWADLDQARTVGAAGWPGAVGWIGELAVNIALDLGNASAAAEAGELLEQAPHDSMEQALCLAARARLLLHGGSPEAAGTAALAAGELLRDGFGVDHPGLVAWRPLAALAAQAAGDLAEARSLAASGVTRATELGPSRALGGALHVAGLVAPAGEAVPLLARATEVLERSPARLEHARALVSLGAALRRAGGRRRVNRSDGDSPTPTSSAADRSPNRPAVNSWPMAPGRGGPPSPAAPR